MRKTNLHGQLYLNGQQVGDVAIRGWEGSWGIGDFTAAPAFAPFAPVFAEWSRLMDADGVERLSRHVADRLRKLETEMYAIRARLFVVEMQQWRQIIILNIDGPLIEWKEGRWERVDERPIARREPSGSSS